MNDMNNDEARLFDNGKKLTFSDCPESSLDGIGSDLLSEDFLKDDTGISRGEGGGSFSDPLLIINNELSSQRQITLDDVVDLDLSSLSTLENNGISQHPQESLGFNDFLSGGSFCLNVLTEKLSEPDKQLGFANFGEITSDRNLCKIQGKEFKIVPTYVEGKLTNTLHLEEHVNPDKIFQRVSSTSASSAPEGCQVTSASEKITATIEDFPSISMVTGNTLTLNGQVQTTLPSSEIEPDICDLIKVKPKEPKKKKPVKTSLTSVKKKRQKKRDRQKNSSEKSSTQNPGSSELSKKRLGYPAVSTPTGDVSKPQPSEPVKNGIPKFKIVHQTESPTICDSDASSIVTSNKSSNGLVFLRPTAPSAGAPTITAATLTVPPPPAEVILPVTPVREENSIKVVQKSDTDLKSGDAPIRNKGLSQMQKQQIAVILKQREALKRATGSSSNGPKRNENKIICKVFCPEDFFEAKVGSTKGDAAKDETNSKSADGNKSSENPPKPKKPKILKAKKPRHPHMSEEFEAGFPLALSITRSGRTSRPPKNLVKRESKLAPAGTVTNEKEDELKPPTGGATSCAEGADIVKPKPELLEGLTTKRKPPKKINISYTCPTCSKSYIEAKVYLKHLEAFPSHGGNDELKKAAAAAAAAAASAAALPAENDSPMSSVLPPSVAPSSGRPIRKCRCKCRNSEKCRARRYSLKQMVDTISEREFIRTCGPRFVKTMSVWDFLLLRIKALYKYEDYVKGILSELVKLWDSLKAVSTKILFPCDRPSESTVMIEDSATCEVLGVSKGIFQTFPSGLETPNPNVAGDYQGETEPSNLQSTIVPPPDTKEDVSQSSLLSDILCDKSGMDTVDQLVSERLKTLAPGDDILDPPSDDLMTSLLNCHSNSLTDSMFNPLVSGSNDDLLKALENLSNPLPPPLDFTALTNDYPDR